MKLLISSALSQLEEIKSFKLDDKYSIIHIKRKRKSKMYCYIKGSGTYFHSGF